MFLIVIITTTGIAIGVGILVGLACLLELKEGIPLILFCGFLLEVVMLIIISGVGIIKKKLGY